MNFHHAALHSRIAESASPPRSFHFVLSSPCVAFCLQAPVQGLLQMATQLAIALLQKSSAVAFLMGLQKPAAALVACHHIAAVGDNVVAAAACEA